MFSKFYSRIIISLIIAVNIGCGIKLGEENKTNHVAEIKGADCLKDSMSNVKLFIAGDATDEQVGTAAECLQKVVLTFKDNIRGKDKHSYTPQELFGFIKNQFMKDSDTEFSPALIAEVMKFKVLLFGGTEDVIQKTEIEALSSFVARFKPELVSLNPHMKVIVSKWKVEDESDLQAKEQKYMAAKLAFNGIIMAFSDFIKEGGRTYKLADLISLLQEVASFTGSTSDLITKIDNLKLFILKTKLILIGGDETLKGSEWTKFHCILAELYFQTLRIQYFITPLTPEQSEEKFYAIQKIAEDLTAKVPELLQGKGAKELTNLEIGELAAAAKPLAPDVEISPELINQIGKIKMMLLGQRPNGFASWTTSEFLLLNKSLPWIFGHVKTLAGGFKHLKFNKNGFRKNEIKFEDFINAEKSVNASIKDIGQQLKNGYDLADLRLLVLNAKPLLKGITLPENLEDIFKLVGTAKYTLTGDPSTTLTIANLQLLLNVGINAYGNAVQFVNFVSPFKLEEPEFVAAFEPVLYKIAGTLKMELALKPSNMITTRELTPLVFAAQNAKVISTQFRPDSLQKAFDVLWTNLLNSPDNRLAGKSLPGFDAVALNNLSLELLFWVDGQKNISAIFANKPEYDKDELKNQLLSRLGAAKAPIEKVTLAELARLLSAPGTMNVNEKGYLKILTDKAPLNGRYHVDDMINSNLSRALARLLIRSLANDKDRVLNVSGLTLDELRLGFDQIKDLGYDLGLLDPANPDFIGGRFREANLFLAPSNGDDFASFEEAHHLILHILSGIARADSLEKTHMAKCVKQPITEMMAKTEFDTACLLDLYINETEPFDDLPNFIKLRKNFEPEKNKQYYCALLKAAGHIPTNNRTVLLRDAKLFPHVVQYVEMIYSTHDTNGDGLLQLDEGIRAFPIFKPLLALIAKKYPIIKEEDLLGVFVYLLKFGKPPEKKNIFQMIIFAKDNKCTEPDGVTPKKCRTGWEIASTRHNLGSIFNFIADQTKPPVDPNAPVPPPTGDPCETVVPPPTPAPAPTPEPVPPVEPSNPEPPSTPSNP